MGAYTLYSDEELTNLLKKGDDIAFEEIYERFFSRLYAHAFLRLKDKSECKDLVQELFANLWARRATVDFSNLSHYLYTSAKNGVINLIAHKAVESKYFSKLPQSISIQECITDYRARELQLAEIIRKEISALPPKMREVFELSRTKNMSHKEIAEHLGITEQSVRSHVKNALKILRVKLGLILYIVFLLTK
jgi:RNA polymerase sigma-70 factor (family 1)